MAKKKTEKQNSKKSQNRVVAAKKQLSSVKKSHKISSPVNNWLMLGLATGAIVCLYFIFL